MSQTNEVQEHTRQLAKSENLPVNVTLLKMENEQIFALAKSHGRDPKLYLEELKKIVDAYPEAADQAIYVKPVGTIIKITCGQCKEEYEVTYIPKDGVNCPKCQSEKIGSQKRTKKFAEGLSIRAAESIRSVYGYTRLMTSTELLPDGNAKVSGMFVDYVSGNITGDERIVSPFFMNRYKQMQTIPQDRFLNVVVKAEKSKLRRDIILDSTPNILKAAFRDYCEKTLEKTISEKGIKEKVLPYFEEKFAEFCKGKPFKPIELVEKLVGRPLSMKWTTKDVLKLSQIKSGLENEETTITELLEGLFDEPQQKAEPTGPVSGSDLSSPTKATDDPEKKPETEKIGPSPGPEPGPEPSSQPSFEDVALLEEKKKQFSEEIRARIADGKDRPDFGTLSSQIAADIQRRQGEFGADLCDELTAANSKAYGSWYKKNKKGKK